LSQNKKNKKLPLKDLTPEELDKVLKEAIEEAKELQRELWEEFKPILYIDAETWNMRFQ
jgi:hypothetical protein